MKKDNWRFEALARAKIARQEEEMKHTKGPWRVEGQDILGDEPNGYICSWSGRSADARLIASAPDMEIEIEHLKSINADLLGACKEFEGLLLPIKDKEKPDDVAVICNIRMGAIRKVIKAISKAERRER